MNVGGTTTDLQEDRAVRSHRTAVAWTLSSAVIREADRWPRLGEINEEFTVYRASRLGKDIQ